jgi:hypothetical protein
MLGQPCYRLFFYSHRRHTVTSSSGICLEGTRSVFAHGGRLQTPLPGTDARKPGGLRDVVGFQIRITEEEGLDVIKEPDTCVSGTCSLDAEQSF